MSEVKRISVFIHGPNKKVDMVEASHLDAAQSELAAVREELAKYRQLNDSLMARNLELQTSEQRLADAERRNAAVQHLSSEAFEVIVGMVEHCLNVRACMGMDEGYKDYLNEEDEHDFVLEIRAFVAALTKPEEAKS